MVYVHYKGTVSVNVSNNRVESDPVDLWVPSPALTDAKRLAVEQVTSAPMIPTVHAHISAGLIHITVGIDCLFTGAVAIWQS